MMITINPSWENIKDMLICDDDDGYKLHPKPGTGHRLQRPMIVITTGIQCTIVPRVSQLTCIFLSVSQNYITCFFFVCFLSFGEVEANYPTKNHMHPSYF